MTGPKTFLITGASGFLGWNLCCLAKAESQTWGTCFTHGPEIPGVNMRRVDLTDLRQVEDLFAQARPDVVVHCAALSSPNLCQEDPSLSFKINVEASENIARLCRQTNAALVFTSSGQIFDGENAPYKETDPPNPVNMYGRHKLLAEEKIRAAHPDAVVCRMPLMFGYGGPCGSSFILPWIRAIQHGQPLTLFTDEIRAPVSGVDAAKGIMRFVGSPHKVLHLGGREAMSRYDFGRLLYALMACPENIDARRQAEAPMSAPRPRNVTMDSSLAFSEGYAPSAVRESLRVELSRILRT